MNLREDDETVGFQVIRPIFISMCRWVHDLKLSSVLFISSPVQQFPCFNQVPGTLESQKPPILGALSQV